ncbi:hypothetical protein Nmel_013399 [Mimus melanotis]
MEPSTLLIVPPSSPRGALPFLRRCPGCPELPRRGERPGSAPAYPSLCPHLPSQLLPAPQGARPGRLKDSLAMPGAAHLQVSLCAGLSLLCLGVLLGCAMCWWHRRRPGRPLGRQRVELGAALPAATVPVPIQQHHEELTGPALGAREKEVSPEPRGGSAHGRASLPTLSFVPQLPGLCRRRCTVGGTELLCEERSPLVPVVPGSPPSSGQRPRLHCDLRYSVPEATLTVTILGVSHLPQGHRGSRVKVALVARAPLSRRVAVRRRSLRSARREPRRCRFGPYGPEELGSCTLRFAVYARSRSLQDSFVGEVLFPCSEASWDPRAPSSYSWELASTKTKLSKHGGAHSPSCSVLCSPPRAQGQLLLLLQLQVPAGRIKVLLRKARALRRLCRLPGSPGEGKATSVSPVLPQARLHARGSVLGRVQVGPGVPGAGMLHWRDMCSLAPLESERWHHIQPQPAPRDWH